MLTAFENRAAPGVANSEHQGQGKIAVFGAGIAGLAAAHELVQLGYAVELYEATSAPGGFFRSTRRLENGNTPSEYSWHGIGPWYHNAFDVLRQISSDSSGVILYVAPYLARSTSEYSPTMALLIFMIIGSETFARCLRCLILNG